MFRTQWKKNKNIPWKEEQRDKTMSLLVLVTLGTRIDNITSMRFKARVRLKNFISVGLVVASQWSV